MFDESKHPRDSDGKFTDGNGEITSLPSAQRIVEKIPKSAWLNNKFHDEIVKVNLDSEIQKRFDNATPKERQKIAYRYIMDNLVGKYAARDGREVSISSVGADKITHLNIDVKLRVSPELANLIKTGEFVGVIDVRHKRFSKMAYYKTMFQIGNEKYVGLLNIGVRHNGESTIYDLNPFNKI